MTVGLDSSRLAVLFELEVVQGIDVNPAKRIGKVFLKQQSGIFFLGILIGVFWLLGYFGRD